MLFRSVPQIEVSFDIDANGIVHVSAKDLGTGNEQKITITASSNLSDQDIEKAVKDAEKFAEEDKKKKEEVDIRNTADSMVYQSEKTIADLGDKLEEQDKTEIESKINAVKETLNGSNFEDMKAATEALQKAFYEISAKIYQQNPDMQGQGPGAGAGDPMGGGGAQGDAGGQQDDPNVYDAEYEVVDDDKEDK